MLRALTVVDERRRAEPQLSAAFARGVHHAEVVDSCPEHGAVGRAQLRYAAQQHLHPLSCKPAEQQFARGTTAAAAARLRMCLPVSR